MCFSAQRSQFARLVLIVVLVEQAFGFVPLPTSSGLSTRIQAQKRSSCLHETLEKNDDSTMEESYEQKKVKLFILDPFPEAANPKYAATAPVGENGFVVSRKGGPTKEELTDENLYKIIDRTASDLEVNTLVWKCLGYRFDEVAQEWTAAEVFPKWKERYPTPPDVVGMQRVYSKDVDGPCLRNNQALVRSIPVDNKKSYLKEFMKPFGFTGYQVAELTPNLTRRAQCTNWLLFYREELFGYTVEELRERRRFKQEKENQEKQALIAKGEEVKEEWKPPVKEVF